MLRPDPKFFLPTERPVPVPCRRKGNARLEAGMQGQAVALEGKKPIRILVLEDNDTARFVFRAVLEPLGYAIVDVVDETEAIRICECAEERFDLLIADVVLKATYGTVTAKRIAL